MFDLKIVGGEVIDGTGTPRYRADVGVRDGRIVALGDVNGASAETIDASGRVVCPGFVDVHTHYDAQAFWDPTFSPSCYHGVTTIFGGFCGFSIAPLNADAATYLLPMLARVEGMPIDTLKAGVPWDWHGFGDFLDRLEGTLGLNAGFFVGHSAVRRVVMGGRANVAHATDDELMAMKSLVAKSLEEGAMGFSTTVSPTHSDADGLPVPSRYASRAELLSLAAVVKDFPGTSLELLPDLDFGAETINLLTDFSLAGQRAVNWNLLGVVGDTPEERERASRMLSASAIAEKKGARVVALTLPSSSTLRINLLNGVVFDMLPGWAELFRVPPDSRIGKLTDPETREALRRAAANASGLAALFTDWDGYIVAEVQAEANKVFEGRHLGEIGAERGTTAFDMLLDIAVEDRLRTAFAPGIAGEDSASYRFRAELWRSPYTIIGGSDAGAHMDMIDSFAFSTKLLQNSRDYDLMRVEEAVHHITQVPAQYFGLKERGVVAIGNHADLTIFDPVRVGCGDTYTRYDLPGTVQQGRLYADAIGIDHVVVNGSVLIRDGALSGARPGLVLRSGRDTRTVPISTGY